MRRLATAAIVAALLTTALTACIGQAVRSTESWLADQSHVVRVEVPSSTVDELSYRATLRAELDPAATDAEIEKLIDDSVDYIADKPDVKLQFGVRDIDFEVATKAGARTALALWHQVLGLTAVVSGFISPDGVAVETLRADAFATFDALAPLQVLRTVEGYHASADFEVGSADFQPPIELTAALDCTPDPSILTLAQTAMTDERVHFGTLDLCGGLDVTFGNDYVLSDGATQVRALLDAAGLSAFPVTISVAPESASSADFHIVAVTPGNPDALGIIPALDGSGLAMRYELSADRSLVIESSAATAAQLLAALSTSAAAASLGVITVTGTDTTVTGAFGDLAG